VSDYLRWSHDSKQRRLVVLRDFGAVVSCSVRRRVYVSWGLLQTASTCPGHAGRIGIQKLESSLADGRWSGSAAQHCSRIFQRLSVICLQLSRLGRSPFVAALMTLVVFPICTNGTRPVLICRSFVRTYDWRGAEKERYITSTYVMPTAYTSVALETFICTSSASINSGAMKRHVPAVVLVVKPDFCRMIAVPKSARLTSSLSLMRTLLWR
jgi:hypothetical protein